MSNTPQHKVKRDFKKKRGRKKKEQKKDFSLFQNDKENLEIRFISFFFFLKIVCIGKNTEEKLLPIEAIEMLKLSDLS